MGLLAEVPGDGLASVTEAPPLWLGPSTYDIKYGRVWSTSCLELLAAPRRDPALGHDAQTGQLRRVASSIARSLASWRNAGSFELRYLWDGAQGNGRLRLVLLGRALGNNPGSASAWATQLVRGVASQFPSGYNFGPLEHPLPTINRFSTWSEIEQVEETREPLDIVDFARYYYMVHPLAGDGSGWHQIFRALLDLPTAGQLSIVLMPTAMTAEERDSIDQICSATAYYGQPWTDYDYYNNPVPMPPDAGAQATLAAWQRYDFTHGLLARMSIGSEAGDAERVASTIGGLVASQSADGHGRAGRFEVVAQVPNYEAVTCTELGLVAPRRRHPVWGWDDQPVSLERMPYYFAEEDAGGLLVLPVPTERGCIGFPESRSVQDVAPPVPATADGDRVLLGLAAGSQQQITLPVHRLNAHLVVGGRVRSGKTTTVHSLLVRLWLEHQVPWLVVEPRATPDYRNLLHLPEMDQLQVFKLGSDDVSPLRLNPLQIPSGRSVDQHVASVLESFQAAAALFEPLPSLLEETLNEVYAAWRPGEPWPTIADLLREFLTVWERYPFQGEASGMVHSMRLRLKRLTQGNVGNVIATSESHDWSAILSRPTVLELSAMNGEQQQLVTTFVLQNVLAAAARRGPSPSLRHIVVLEEAHNLLSAPTAAAPDDPRLRAVERLINAIAEVGATGQSFFIVDQRPGALHPAVIANSATKIIHRQESATERDALMADIGATPAEVAAAEQLETGEAIVKLPDHHRPVITRITPLPGVNTLATTTDEQVRTDMASTRREELQLLPTTLCTRNICEGGCDRDRRAQGTTEAHGLARTSGMTLAGAAQRANQAAESLADRYCTLMHYELEQLTLVGRPEQVRARLVRELDKTS